MVKKLIKKLLIVYLKKRKGRFSGTLYKSDMATLARTELGRIRVRNESEFDQADEFWRSSEAQALQELLAPDGLEHFLRLRTIHDTMFEYYAPMLINEYLWLRRISSQISFDLGLILQEDAVGDPIPFLLETSTSGNLLHHAYHYMKYREFAGGALEHIKHITEFGGGYGSMCRVFLRSGFGGKYVIIDLKTFSILQTYFLNCIGYPAQITPERVPYHEVPRVECVTQYKVPQEVKLDEHLFLATWSLSETGLDVRNEQLQLLERSRYFLLAFRDTFEGVDNLSWFKSYLARRLDVRWKLEPIPHIPNSYYLFGAPNE